MVNAEVWAVVMLVCYVFEEVSLLSVTFLQERGNKKVVVNFQKIELTKDLRMCGRESGEGEFYIVLFLVLKNSIYKLQAVKIIDRSSTTDYLVCL